MFKRAGLNRRDCKGNPNFESLSKDGLDVCAYAPKQATALKIFVQRSQRGLQKIPNPRTSGPHDF